jgi:hypothetical protein
MFASAIAPVDPYSEADVLLGLEMLAQSDSDELLCVYCDGPAETWDHLQALVLGGQFSGHGHQLGNLVPSCKSCNSKKGNKDYRVFLRGGMISAADAEVRIERIGRYSAHFLPRPMPQGEYERLWPREMAELRDLQAQILTLMQTADVRAADLREKARSRELPKRPVSNRKQRRVATP